MVSASTPNDAKRQAVEVHPAADPRAHDERDPGETRHQPGQPQRLEPFAEDEPARQRATSSGMVEAMIAASEASTVCIATKFSPR